MRHVPVPGRKGVYKSTYSGRIVYEVRYRDSDGRVDGGAVWKGAKYLLYTDDCLLQSARSAVRVRQRTVVGVVNRAVI